MDKFDARSLSEESLEVLRRQAHRLRCEGRTWSEIASIVGVHLSTVMSWSRRFDIGSVRLRDVISGQRGRRFGEGRTLDLADEVGLREVILGGPPSRLGLAYDALHVILNLHGTDGFWAGKADSPYQRRPDY